MLRTDIFDKIYAFEADAYNFSQLQANIFLNKAARKVAGFQNAVSDKNAAMHFMDSLSHPTGNRGGVGLMGEADNSSTSEVMSLTIDSKLALKDANLVVKIDVEGHEAFVVSGMANTIRDNRIIMQIEIFDNQLDSVLPELARLGLRKIHRIEHDFYFTNIDDINPMPAHTRL